MNIWLKEGSYQRLSNEKTLPGGFRINSDLVNVSIQTSDFTANGPSGTIYINDASGTFATLGNVPIGTQYTFFNNNAGGFNLKTPSNTQLVGGNWNPEPELGFVYYTIDTVDLANNLSVGELFRSVTVVKVKKNLWIMISNNGGSLND